MTISLNPSISRNNVHFGASKKQERIDKEIKKEELRKLLRELEKDEDKKDGPVQKWKNFVSGWKKFFMHIREYTEGTVSGLFKGGIAGGAFLGLHKLQDVYDINPKNANDKINIAIRDVMKESNIDDAMKNKFKSAHSGVNSFPVDETAKNIINDAITSAKTVGRKTRAIAKEAIKHSNIDDAAKAIVDNAKKVKTKHYIIPAAILTAITAIKIYKTSLKVSILDDKIERKYNTGHSDDFIGNQ